MKNLSTYLSEVEWHYHDNHLEIGPGNKIYLPDDKTDRSVILDTVKSKKYSHPFNV